MSLGGFLDGSGGGGAAARVVVDMPYGTPAGMPGHGGGPFSTPTSLMHKYNNAFNSPGLSLGLTNLDGSVSGGLGGAHLGGAGGGLVVDFVSSPAHRNNAQLHNHMNGGNNNNHNHQSNNGMLANNNTKDQGADGGYDSRSGSDNIGGGSGDDIDPQDMPTNGKRKRYHRHTPQQIQELEALFKECPHPDEKQRMELSRRLSLESRQVKFWFQNRRTQMKTQLKRHENQLLKHQNDRLKAENLSYREAMRNPVCNSCGSPAMLGEVSLEEQHLRIENARLKEELERVYELAGKFLGRPISSLQQQQHHHHQVLIGNGGFPMSSLELAVGTNNNNNNSNGCFTGVVNPGAMVPASGPGLIDGVGHGAHQQQGGGVDRIGERTMFLEMALSAMDELVKLVQAGEPLWTGGRRDGNGKETLRCDEYLRIFPKERQPGFVAEATRESGTVIINSAALVEIVMDEKRWADIFSCMIARAESLDEISGGVAGTRNGALKLMHAELQVLSPLVPVRSSNFLRFCKQHAEGVWAVVDVSVDAGLVRDAPGAGAGNEYIFCRRLPSGFVVQDLPNGYSKVTWVEHAEYDENLVHNLYRPLLRSGLGFGASRWVATLHRQCECLAILMASTAAASSSPPSVHEAITPAGRKSMVKLAKRMTDNFCSGVCPSTGHKWNRLRVDTVGDDVRVMTRKSVSDPGEPPGVVLSAATSVWLPNVAPARLFDFLRDERLRSEWDILSNGGPMQEMAHIAKGQDPGNGVSLLRASAAMGANQSSMLILQETCTDASGSLVVYAPVDIPAMHAVMQGGDSAYVALLPSGFAIVPDTSAGCRPDGADNSNSNNDGSPRRASAATSGGSLLTVAFQILVNSQPTARLTVESVETVNNLISCTVQKIKAAIQADA